jgi:hypothetical protein
LIAIEQRNSVESSFFNFGVIWCGHDTVWQVYRCYRSDASFLTDLVRCQIVFAKLCDLDVFMKVTCQRNA